MKLKVEHAIIAVLVLVLLYYIYSHYSLLGDLSLVPNNNNPKLKAIKDKHHCGRFCHMAMGAGSALR